MSAERGPYQRSQPTRAAILAAVRAEPGATKAEVCRRTGYGWGTVSHHVRRMVRDGELVAERTLRRVYLYPPSLTSAHMFWMRLLRQDMPRRILGRLAPGEARKAAEMSDELGVPRSTIRRYLSEMQHAGLLRREPGARFALDPGFRDGDLRAQLGDGLDPVRADGAD